ncbi:MAG: hypothetical protein NT000_04440 [Proteobacteria bacterium]|nr:hypothetical protein [Pseudomonadota bacterium]
MLTLATVLHYPIFTDEISFKIIYSRYFLDSGKAIFLWPQCNTEFTDRFPISFLPFRILESFLFQDLTNPLKIRWFGVLYFCLYLLLICFIVDLLFKNKKKWSFGKTLILSLGLNSLGTLPITLSYNRPESPMVLFLFIVVLIPLLHERFPFFAKKFHFLSLAIIIISSAGFVSYHPKGLFFVPVFCVAILLISRGVKDKIVTLMILTGVIVTSFSFWNKQYACPMDQKTYQSINSVGMSQLSPATSVSSKTVQFFNNFISSQHYLHQIVFPFTTMEKAGLRQGTVLGWGWRLWNRLIEGAIIGLGLSIVLATYFIFRSWFRLKENDFKGWLFLALILSLVAHLGVTTRKAFYDNALIFPTFFLLSLLGLNSFPRKLNGTVLNILSITVLLLASGSSLFFLYGFSPMVDVWKQGGAVPDEYFLTSGYNHSETNNRVRKLASRCGISPDARPFHLVVDEISYPSFWQSREPFIAIQIFFVGQKQMDLDATIFLRLKRSAGFIGQCKYLSKELSHLVTQEKDLCCIPSFV